MGEFREPGELADQYERLGKADANNVAERSGVYGIEMADVRLPYKRPDIETWIRFMSRREYNAAADRMEHELNVMSQERKNDRGTIKRRTKFIFI